MTHIEQAFHEKFIKGITIKLIVTVMLSTISIIGAGAWGVANAYSNLKQSIIDGNTKCMQFTKDQVSGLRLEMSSKFDTIKINQILFNYNTKLEIQSAKNEIQHRQGIRLATEKKKNGVITFIPYVSQK